MVKFHRNLTQIIFFDLEFYVPVNDRDSDRSDLRANPFKSEHFLIGGNFIRLYPLQKSRPKEKFDFWIWNYIDEKEMLNNIVGFLESSWDIVNSDNDQCDLIVCGIGISRVDIGYLFSRCIENRIADKIKLFSLFYQLRILDLENIVIPFFKSTNGLLYPKTTIEMINKFRLDRIRENGMGIWEHYDKQEFQKIKKRNDDEVDDLITLYWKIVDIIVANNIAPKYSVESYAKMNHLLKTDDERKLLGEVFTYSENEERYVLNDNVDLSLKTKLFWLLHHSGYMKKKRSV